MWVVEQDIPLYLQVILDVPYQLKKKRTWGAIKQATIMEIPRPNNEQKL